MANVRALSKDLQQTACEELFEQPERLQADIEALKEWIQQQPHLKARTDDQWLLAFLRGCKFSLEKAKSKIDRFYTLRTKFPDYFACKDVDDALLREILATGCILLLPNPLHENGARIILMRNGIVSPTKYPVMVFARLLIALQEITMLEDDFANVNGMAMVVDMVNSTPAHMLLWTPSFLKKMSVFSQEALPLRPKCNIFVNTPTGSEAVFNIMKSMMRKKHQTRLYICGNKFDKLYEHIPKKYLPKEYGGENGSVEEIITYWNKKLDEYRAYFQQEDNYGTNEMLRPGKAIDFENMFGLEGSFRKLEVD